LGRDIEQWSAEHPRWPELWAVVARLGQEDWMNAVFEWHRSHHVLVALEDGQVAGFLRFVVQDIGLEDDHDLLIFNGAALSEAKVLAFGVPDERRNRGLGRALQLAAMDVARELGCYQMRSHSGGESQANHYLKLALGFAVFPVLRGDDTAGVYFSKAL
jgi:GNAT superfamily N-acetyltransferase